MDNINLDEFGDTIIIGPIYLDKDLPRVKEITEDIGMLKPLNILEKDPKGGYKRAFICKCGNMQFYRIANAKKVRKCHLCYRKEHLKKLSKINKIQYGESSFNRIYRRYKTDAKRRNLEFNIDKEKFRSLIDSNCFYCGIKPSSIQKADNNNGEYIYNGIDRKRNDVGYIEDNVVSCCSICNRMKWMMTDEEFLNKCNEIYSNQLEKEELVNYYMLMGRFQVVPPHKGHCALINTLLDEGKKVLIPLRKSSFDNKNPYNFDERINGFKEIYKKEIDNGDIKIIPFYNVVSVNYGRDVGYKIEEIKLDPELEKISATKIRNEK